MRDPANERPYAVPVIDMSQFFAREAGDEDYGEKDKDKDKGKDTDDDEAEDDEPVPDWNQKQFEQVFREYRERNKRYYDDFSRTFDRCPQLRVRRASRLATRLFDQILRERMLDVDQADLILRSTQIPVLAAIVHADGRQTMQDIASTLYSDPSTLTRSVDVLEERGFVERVVARHDRRVRTVRITPDGRDVLARNVGWWRIARETLMERCPGHGEEQRKRRRAAYEGVDLVFHIARRCMYDRGYHWEMCDPPDLQL